MANPYPPKGPKGQGKPLSAKYLRKLHKRYQVVHTKGERKFRVLDHKQQCSHSFESTSEFMDWFVEEVAGMGFFYWRRRRCELNRRREYYAAKNGKKEEPFLFPLAINEEEARKPIPNGSLDPEMLDHTVDLKELNDPTELLQYTLAEQRRDLLNLENKLYDMNREQLKEYIKRLKLPIVVEKYMQVSEIRKLIRAAQPQTQNKAVFDRELLDKAFVDWHNSIPNGYGYYEHGGKSFFTYLLTLSYEMDKPNKRHDFPIDRPE